MKSSEFQDLLRTMHCLSYSDFQKIWGDSSDHFWRKFTSLDLCAFIGALDYSNLEYFFQYAREKRKQS